MKPIPMTLVALCLVACAMHTAEPLPAPGAADQLAVEHLQTVLESFRHEGVPVTQAEAESQTARGPVSTIHINIKDVDGTSLADSDWWTSHGPALVAGANGYFQGSGLPALAMGGVVQENLNTLSRWFYRRSSGLTSGESGVLTFILSEELTGSDSCARAFSDPTHAVRNVILMSRRRNCWTALNLAHEIGHWYGLHHTFGPTVRGDASDADCSRGDDVDDTPAHISSGVNRYRYRSTSCSGPVECVEQQQSIGDGIARPAPYDNVMSYSGCPTPRFTSGQFVRMREAWMAFYDDRGFVASE